MDKGLSLLLWVHLGNKSNKQQKGLAKQLQQDLICRSRCPVKLQIFSFQTFCDECSWADWQWCRTAHIWGSSCGYVLSTAVPHTASGFLHGVMKLFCLRYYANTKKQAAWGNANKFPKEGTLSDRASKITACAKGQQEMVLMPVSSVSECICLCWIDRSQSCNVIFFHVILLLESALRILAPRLVVQ